MPSTDSRIEKISTATYGREVRQPIADLLEDYHESATEIAEEAIEHDHSEEYLESFFPGWRDYCDDEDDALTQIEETHETRFVDYDIDDLGYTEDIYLEKIDNEDSMVHFTELNRFDVMPESDEVIHTGDKVIFPFNAYDIRCISRQKKLIVQVDKDFVNASEGTLNWEYIGPAAKEQSAIVSDNKGTANYISEEDFVWDTGEMENDCNLSFIRNTTE